MYESRTYARRTLKSLWFRKLTERGEVYGDRGYSGVEGVIGGLKGFNAVSRWRKGITLLACLYGYAIAYSFSRGGLAQGNFSPDV
ncbi:MAG: hypothetical protein N2648_05015 [Aquificaceae bacterium]|nr:hypothetical protein [Aquificaceae bacterium]